MMKILLQHEASSDFDEDGVTPLLIAAKSLKIQIVEYLTSLPSCGKREKVEAFELLGATFIDERSNFQDAFTFWKLALEERYKPGEIPLEKILQPPVAAYNHQVEVTTVEQLNDLNPDDMRMEALLIRERILGAVHPDTSYFLVCRADQYEQTGLLQRSIKLWLYTLEIQQKVRKPAFGCVEYCLFSLTTLFLFLLKDTFDRHAVHFSDVISAFQFAVQEISKIMQRNENNLKIPLKIAIHLIGIMCALRQNLNSEQDFQMKQQVYHLVQLNPLGWFRSTILHMVCNPAIWKSNHFPCFEVAKCLLEVGASPNVLDIGSDTPLHIAAMFKPFSPALFKLLLEHGAHFDICNTDGQTPFQCLSPADIAMLDIHPLQYTTLQCLSARAIKRSNIDFVGRVPRKFEEFINLH